MSSGVDFIFFLYLSVLCVSELFHLMWWIRDNKKLDSKASGAEEDKKNKREV